MKIIIDETISEIKILDFLKKRLGVSHRQLTKIKAAERGITVNGEHKTVRYILKSGDELEIMLEDSETGSNDNIVPKDIPIDIVYEDEYLTIVNKPPYMPTHPSFNHYEDTLANALKYRYESSAGKTYIFRPVNRLDRNTSGLVLTANSQLSASKLSNLIKEGGIRKSYIAVLHGKLEKGRGIIKNYIRRQADTIILREQTDDPSGADLALTKYECFYSSDKLSIVRAMPVTGRTHQLRVHFSGLGHPIYGDDLYGGEVSEIGRQALHAYGLEFTHPFSGEKLECTAALPEDIKKLIFKITGDELKNLIL